MTTSYVTAWRKNDPKLEADATRFWEAHELLPAGKTAEDRIKELAVLAYDGEQVIGVSTVNIRYFDMLRQKFAFFREAIAPDYRLQSAGRDLTVQTRKAIEAYALAHLEEEIAGLAAILQAPGIGKRAIGRQGRLALIGYTDFNEQVRVAWFDHFRVPSNMSDMKP
ncbi:MAG: hypothetical protein ACOH12_03155 [Parvibaculaceae bacterium]